MDEDRDNASSATNSLSKQLGNLSLTNSKQATKKEFLALPIATNEFYYILGLSNLEHLAVQSSAVPDPVRATKRDEKRLLENLENLSLAEPLPQVQEIAESSPRTSTFAIATNEFYYNSLNNIEEVSKPSSLASTNSIASNEFYYNSLNNIEEASAELPIVAKRKASPSKSEKEAKKKKELAEQEFAVSSKKIPKKLRKLKVPAPSAQQLLRPIGKTQESAQMSENESPMLLARLKDLQSGRISSEQLQKYNPLPPPMRSHHNKHDDSQRYKEQVQRINMKIQRTITQQIKPNLRQILDYPDQRTVNGFNRNRNSSESSQSLREQPIVPHRRSIPKQTRAVPTGKTKVKTFSEEEVEIYRYSKDDLKQLQSLGTFEIIPRLQRYQIYKSAYVQSDYDLLLLKLLSARDDEERLAFVLEAAEKRKLIERKGPTDFKFSPISAKEEEPEEPKVERAPRREPERLIISEIERLKSIAKSDDELNELIFQYEFSNLFKDAMAESGARGMSLTETIKYLVDSNQAYLIEGEIRVNGRKNQEAYVTQGNGKKDVCVNKMILRKHAFEGDFVRVLVKQKSGGEEEFSLQKEEGSEPSSDVEDDLEASIELEIKDNVCERHFGCVLEILEKRHSRRVIGTLEVLRSGAKKSRKNVSFAVRDTKIPHVQLKSRDLPKQSTENMLMVAQITGWSHDTPKGMITEVIGVKGELKAENASILLQHNLNPEPYSQDILDQLPTEPFTIPAEEFAYRQDLRKKCIFSIDPETARDLDDALSCEVLPNGNLEIGVHISDVTYFLKENSTLDEIVKKKATTIYLVDTVYHMLPVPLCLLCSLLPGADKMAYSVFWEMNADTAEIKSTRFTRSVVNSCAKLSYDHAQAVLEKENQNWSELDGFPEIYNGFTVSDVANVIVQLQKIAVILRAKRKESGSLKIDQPKIAFKFDKDDQRMEAPVDFFQYPIKDSNRLIEDFMLLANISVAKFIYEKFPEISLLRHHLPPKENALKKLVNTLGKSGIDIDVNSAASLSASMERLIGSSTSTAGMNAVLNLMVSKTMTRAAYFCSAFADGEEGFKHYALSMPIYTHFTSPIRRYADVMVHRVLNAALGYEDPPSRTPDEVQELASICNAQKYSAKLAGDDSSNLYFMQFIRSLKTRSMMAGVVGIFDYNLEVVLVETGHVLKVFYKNLQHNDDVIVTAFTNDERPHVIVRWPKLKMVKLNIAFGSQLLLELSVSKDKLVANKIFYHQ